MNGSLAVKVRIRNSEGKYLAGDLANWGFSSDPSKAIVFDYLRHQVAEQLEELRQTRGIYLEAVPVAPNEVYETCDQCHRFITAFGIFFDGCSFLCFDCLARNSLYAAPLLSKVEGSQVVQTKS